ncbi:MAG: hypothetical protein JF614_03315 [Acidobacteria bacterium]|nr:hypothetical protein [Acidobacteriota bacterium]
MKTLLRTSGLVALLSLTALATARGARISSSFGTCRTTCVGSGSFTTASWQTTESQCCSGTVNPCPPGMTPGASSFTPAGGFARFCRPANG